MRGFLRLIAVLCIGAASLVPIQAAGAEPDQGGEPPGQERVRVVLELTNQGHADSVLAGLGNRASNVQRLSHLPIIILEVPEPALAGLRNNPHVVAVVEDEAQPPSLASTLPVINADDVHALGFTGAGTTVAILDTGIDDDHDFFGTGGSRIIAERCFSNAMAADEFSLCPDGTATDTDADIDSVANCMNAGNNICDHGTHVAGIAAGSAATDVANAPGNGVAPDANIIAIQVFTRFNSAADCLPSAAPCVLSYVTDQVLGLNAVVALTTANPAWNVVAANMSLGGGNNASACDADTRKAGVDALLGLGVATTIASGNSGFLASVGAPACISTAVTVGNSTDADNIAATSNRGVLLDLFAPGTSVISSEAAGTYGSKGGTSMAAPHVAGALAVLSEASPARSINNLVGDLASTGVPINYNSGGNPISTPRIDLLAALEAANEPPDLTVDNETVTVDEGVIATNSGTATDGDGTVENLTASRGTVTLNGDGTWDWSEQTSDGPTDGGTVTITATDDKGESADIDFELVVDNVDPTVMIDAAQVKTIDENGTLAIAASFTDPGWPDTYVVSIDYGTTEGAAGPTVVDWFGVRGMLGQGSVSSSYTYGDNGTFTVTVTVTDDDGGVGMASFEVTVGNVDPTATIDLTGSDVWNGMNIVFGEAGAPVDLDADTTDPGSDDLTLTWDYDDGTTDARVDLVNPPASDGLPSPTVQPRNVGDPVSHVFGTACAYTVAYDALDDDGGTDDDTVQVIIVGNADDARSMGYWMTEYRKKRNTDFTPDELDCFLAITNVMSSVFSEVRPLGSHQQAVDVLWLTKNDGPTDIFDAQLLAVWLNFANGAITLDQLVDTDGDTVPDTSIGDVLIDAEAARTNPATPSSVLLDIKDVLAHINLTL